MPENGTFCIGGSGQVAAGGGVGSRETENRGKRAEKVGCKVTLVNSPKVAPFWGVQSTPFLGFGLASRGRPGFADPRGRKTVLCGWLRSCATSAPHAPWVWGCASAQPIFVARNTLRFCVTRFPPFPPRPALAPKWLLCQERGEAKAMWGGDMDDTGNRGLGRQNG